MRIPKMGLVSLFCLTIAVAGTGCGGTSDNAGVASADGASPTASATASADPGGNLSEQDRAVKFAQCMRANGVPNFKDPKPGDGGVAIDLPEGVSKAQADAAMDKCKQYLPGGGVAGKIDPEQIEKNRQLAKCMRQNGVPNYPDPGPDGGIQIGNGVDPNSAAFKAAQQKCQKDLPPGSLESH